MITELNAVIAVLDAVINPPDGTVTVVVVEKSVKEAIAKLTDEIETLKAQIEASQDALADNVISETELTAKIAVETDELNQLILERDAALESANQYFDLYLAALAG
jgi:uncharacterized small protein (DUF1192 family)